MQRVHRISFVAPHEPYRLIKRFRHEEELGYEPVKWHKNIFDKDKGEIFGSTPLRWLIRFIFYLCLYLGICLLWFICYIVFSVTLYDTKPTYYLKNFAPGMSFSPHIGSLTFPEIVYRDKKNIDIDPYTREIDHFLSKYGILYEDFGNCTADQEYGYMERMPCIFLKLNRIFNFEPKTYDSAAELPGITPPELQLLVKELKPEERKNRVWVSCTATREGVTKFEYWPKVQSVPAKLLTVKKKKAYSDGSLYSREDYKRIVAVQISGFDLDEKFTVKCHTWAKNIQQIYDGYGNRGYLHFTIHVKRGVFFSVDY